MATMPSKEQRHALRERNTDPETRAALEALERAADLLERSLWEFGSELRVEIERFLNEPRVVGR